MAGHAGPGVSHEACSLMSRDQQRLGNCSDSSQNDKMTRELKIVWMPCNFCILSANSSALDTSGKSIDQKRVYSLLVIQIYYNIDIYNRSVKVAPEDQHNWDVPSDD